MRYKETTLKPANIRLERDLIDRLDEVSESIGMSKSYIIRTAVRKYLNMEQG